MLRLRRLVPLAALLLPLAAPAAAAESPGALGEGDAAWSRRADGAKGGTALPGPVDAALAAYRKAVAEGGGLPARWRVMRALYFKGEHTVSDPAEKRRVFDEGRKAGDEALDAIRKEAGARTGKALSEATPVDLVPSLSGNRDAALCFLWASVNWGKWALVFGKTAAARQGAAARIRDYATAVIQLDPALDDGGGYRVLGRLHHQTPSIPFVTGWASRTKALENLRLAIGKGPRHFVNRLYLAEAMWDYEKERRGEARAMLETLVAETPGAEYAVEDARTQEDARSALAGFGR